MDSQNQNKWILDGEFHVRNTDGKLVAVVNHDGVPSMEWEANAHLLAAAPELLQELRRLRKLILPTIQCVSNLGVGDSLLAVLDTTDAVIAKALNGPDPSAEPNDHSPEALAEQQREMVNALKGIY